MPISREQFDKGLDDTQQKILNFLKAHPDKAFNANEIEKNIFRTNEEGMLIVAIVVGIALDLDRLTEKNLLDKKAIHGRTYYSIHRS